MSRPLVALSAILALIASGGPAAADTWMAPIPLLAASEDGCFYVISNPKDGWTGVDLLLVRRADGKAPPAAPKREGPAFETSPPLAPEAGDEVLARAEGHTPLQVRCLDGGRGFVLFESWGGLGYGIVLAAYDGEGRIRWKRELGDFFTRAEIQDFMRTASSIHWFRGLWIDEGSQEVVVVAHGPSLLRVGLADGKKRDGGKYDLLGRIGRGPLAEQLVAMDAAVDLADPSMLDPAREGFGRAGVELAVRVRCAVLMAKVGDRSGSDLVAEAAREGHEEEIRYFAILHLPTVMGADAIPVLQGVLRGPFGQAWGYAQSALASLGEAAIPALVEMLRAKEERVDSRDGAAAALARMGEVARPAVPALVAMAGGALANTALNALVEILPDRELGPLFVRLLDEGTGDDSRIALYFEQHPAREATPGLVRAFERAEMGEGANTQWYVDALTRCARRSVGTTAAAWRKWLDSTGAR